MELSSEQLIAVADWRKKHLKRRQNNLEELQEILGLQSGFTALEDYALDGHFAFPPIASEFDPDYIEKSSAHLITKLFAVARNQLKVS